MEHTGDQLGLQVNLTYLQINGTSALLNRMTVMKTVMKKMVLIVMWYAYTNPNQT